MGVKLLRSMIPSSRDREPMGARNPGTFLPAATILLAAWVSRSARAQPEVPPWAKVSPAQAAAAKKLGVPVAFENSVGMRFALIPAGTFLMGSGESPAEVARRCAMPNAQPGWFYDEHPRHEVTLTEAFYMSIHEVTQGCYEAVIHPKPKDTDKSISDQYPDAFKGPNHPVVKVSWGQAENFCKILGSRDAEKGRRYFLPTEAQWEYACRAGTSTPFSFGKTISTEQANYNGGYIYGDGRKGEYRARPLPVGSFPPNPWGLYDMHGNVSEWSADRYGRYGGGAETDPVGPEEGNWRVVRGGSWRSYPGACRSAFRLRRGPGSSALNIGFRIGCALTTESSAAADPQGTFHETSERGNRERGGRLHPPGVGGPERPRASTSAKTHDRLTGGVRPRAMRRRPGPLPGPRCRRALRLSG